MLLLLLPFLPLLLIVSTLPHLTTAKPKPTPILTATYPCLTSFPSPSEPGITKMLPNGTLDTSVYFLTSGCKAGSKTFSYECGDQDCCKSTDEYDGGSLEAKLPKGWYVYGCTEWSMCVGRHKYSDTYQFGAGEYQWDCDGEVTR